MEMPRDQLSLFLIETFKIVSLPQIYKYAFVNRAKEVEKDPPDMKRARDRMRQLCDRKLCNRVRGHIDQFYVYYPISHKKPPAPSAIEHRLKLVDFYIAMSETAARIMELNIEYPLEDIRPDGYITFRLMDQDTKRESTFSFFIEVHRNGWFDAEKYTSARKIEMSKEHTKFRHFPAVIVISDKNIVIPTKEESGIHFIQIREDMSDFRIIFDHRNSLDGMYYQSEITPKSKQTGSYPKLPVIKPEVVSAR